MSTDPYDTRLSIYSTALQPSALAPNPVDKQMLSFGFRSWTAPFGAWGGAQTLAGGTLYVAPCWFEAGLQISQFFIAVTSDAKNISFARWGVYHIVSKALLASSGDLTSILTGGEGTRVLPLQAPWTAPEDRNYLCGLLQVGPAPAKAAGSLPVAVTTYGAAQQAGLADLPNPIVPASTTVQVNYGAG